MMLKRFLLVCAAMALLAGCQMDVAKSLDAANDLHTAATLSQEDAAKMGQEAAAQMDQQNKVAPENSAYAKRLAKITRGLKKEDGLALNFKVYISSDVNAFALPDGSLRFYSGLMDMMTDEEVFFVVGHEIGHVKNGDSLNAFRLAYAASGARKAAGAAGGVAGALSASQLGDLTEKFVNAQFSQKQEYAADAHGFELMKKHKKDTKGAVTALRKLATLSDTSSMLASHPAPGKRADKLESMR